MMRLNDDVSDLKTSLAPIGLEELNAKAAMLERIDNKYVISEDVLAAAAPELNRHFDILEIDSLRSFTYRSWYFDDADMSSYFDHLRGRRRRGKIRVRNYKDTGLCFVEVKLKDRRGQTIKRRLPYAQEKYGELDQVAYSHIRDCYQSLYQVDFDKTLAPVLEVAYDRMTLVAKQGGERLTLDSNLRFRRGSRSWSVPSDTYVVETKSTNGNGIADKILRALHQHPTEHCSKYCVGLASSAEVSRYNKFIPALRKLELLPAVPDAGVRIAALAKGL